MNEFERLRRNILINNNLYNRITTYCKLNSIQMPEGDIAYYYKNFINELEISGICDKLDLLYVFLGTSGNPSRNFNFINVINPDQYNGIEYDNLTLGPGYIKNNGSAYIDTGFNPTIGENKYKLNRACRGCFLIPTSSTYPGIIDGVLDTSTTYINSIQNKDNTAGAKKINQGTNTFSGTGGIWTEEFCILQRSSNTEIEDISGGNMRYRNVNSTSLYSANQAILRAGGYVNNTTRDVRLFAYFMGGYLDGDDRDNLDWLIQSLYNWL